MKRRAGTNDSDLIRDGQCLAWRLMDDKRCPSQARELVRATAQALRIPAGRVQDAMLMASELASNAVEHSGHPELWMYLRGQGRHARLVCTVFDGGDGFRYERRSATVKRAMEAESGWGLHMVDALAGPSGWGHNLSRSRLSPQIPGAVTWFTIPVSARLLISSAARLGAADGIFQLAAQITARGVQHVRATNDGKAARLWVQPDLEIRWKLGHISCEPLWRPQQAFQRTAHDFVDVVEEVIRLHEEGSSRKKMRIPCRTGTSKALM